jgi:hypothetical protein
MSKEFQPLEKLIDKYFNFNLSRKKCLSQFILLIANLRTINLAVICQAMFSRAQPGSSYKRLIRFLNCEVILQKPLSKLIVAIKRLDEIEKWKLSIDRTNWRFGKKDINILYLSVCYKNVAIPLFFLF